MEAAMMLIQVGVLYYSLHHKVAIFQMLITWLLCFKKSLRMTWLQMMNFQFKSHFRKQATLSRTNREGFSAACCFSLLCYSVFSLAEIKVLLGLTFSFTFLERNSHSFLTEGSWLSVEASYPSFHSPRRMISTGLLGSTKF